MKLIGIKIREFVLRCQQSQLASSIFSAFPGPIKTENISFQANQISLSALSKLSNWHDDDQTCLNLFTKRM